MENLSFLNFFDIDTSVMPARKSARPYQLVMKKVKTSQKWSGPLKK
jgi:hypothetical protein